MAVRKTTKKATRKGASKKSLRKATAKKTVRKAAAKKVTRKAVAKKGARKTAVKKRARNPLKTATKLHLAAGKQLATAKKAYDRAVIAEARAAEKLKAVNEKIAKKVAKSSGPEVFDV